MRLCCMHQERVTQVHGAGIAGARRNGGQRACGAGWASSSSGDMTSARQRIRQAVFFAESLNLSVRKEVDQTGIAPVGWPRRAAASLRDRDRAGKASPQGEADLPEHGLRPLD